MARKRKLKSVVQQVHERTRGGRSPSIYTKKTITGRGKRKTLALDLGRMRKKYRLKGLQPITPSNTQRVPTKRKRRRRRY